MKAKLSILILLAIMNAFALMGQAPDWEWAHQFDEDDSYSMGYPRLATNENGDIYITGIFQSAIQFGNIVLNNPIANTPAMFIVKYNSSGDVIWAKYFICRTYGIVVDNKGFIYITGSYDGPDITLGNSVLSNSDDRYFSAEFFLMKLDPSGNIVWARSANGKNADWSTSIATDISGNIYVGGIFTSPMISFDNFTLTNDNALDYANGNPDIFIVKFDSEGKAVWAKSAKGGPHGVDHINSIAADDQGYIYFAGTFSGDELIFDNETLTNYSNNGLDNFYFLKIDQEGKIALTKNVGGTNSYVENAWVAVDKDGNLYVTGSFVGDDLKFENNILASKGADDIFIVKYDPLGMLKWVKSAGDIDYDRAWGITTDEYNNLYITGSFSVTLSLENIFLTSNGGFNLFIAKYNTTGNVQWAKTADGRNSSEGIGVISDKQGGIYLEGIFSSSSLVLGNIIFVPDYPNFSFFIAKLNSNSSALPVNWGIFTAAEIGKDVLLKWTTLQEENTYQYQVERSADGHRFSKIGSVNTAGNSTSPTTYQFIDEFPLAGVNFYRLKQIDIDGNFEYSRIIRINASKANTYKTVIAPNPFSNVTTISFSLAQSEKVSLKIFDLNGRLITTLANEEMVAGSHEIKWNVNAVNGKSISSGIYLLRLEAGDLKETLKISVIK